MNVALRRPMTLAEFLDWEERQPTKYEFDGHRPVAMVGVTNAHSIIQNNLAVALGTRLRGTPCQAHGSDFKISVAGRIRYPDAMVVCGPMAANAKVAADPIVLFEILSESSGHTDLVLKNREYRETRSVQHYVVLEQVQAGVIVFSRKGEDWVSEALTGQDAVLHLPAIGIEVTVAELYEKVPLMPEQAEREETA